MVDFTELVESESRGLVAAVTAIIGDEGVWPAASALPRDQAIAIALRYGADLGVEDMAETLGSIVPAVKPLLHRGRATLRSSPTMQSYADRGADPS